jgi:hypothetical protein
MPESAKNLRQALGAVMPLGPDSGHPVPMIYKVVAETTPDCDCEECLAGRHLYSLFYWKDGKWMHAGFSLQTYTSPEDCMQNHWWGVQFAARCRVGRRQSGGAAKTGFVG